MSAGVLLPGAAGRAGQEKGLTWEGLGDGGGGEWSGESNPSSGGKLYTF